MLDRDGLPVGVGNKGSDSYGDPTKCWSSAIGRFICGYETTGSLGLCREHHHEIVGSTFTAQRLGQDPQQEHLRVRELLAEAQRPLTPAL